MDTIYWQEFRKYKKIIITQIIINTGKSYLEFQTD